MITLSLHSMAYNNQLLNSFLPSQFWRFGSRRLQAALVAHLLLAVNNVVLGCTPFGVFFVRRACIVEHCCMRAW